MCKYKCQGPLSPDECIETLGGGVKCGCELPNMDVGNKIHVLCNYFLALTSDSPLQSVCMLEFHIELKTSISAVFL